MTATELDREIGLGGAVSLGVGSMIAAGIFVLSGVTVGRVGAMAIVSFLVAAFVAGVTALSDAEFVGVADGPHAETSVSAAAAVARATDARLGLYRAVPSSVDEESLESARPTAATRT